VLPEQQEHKEFKVYRVLPERQDRPVRKVFKAYRERQELQDRPDRRVFKVYKVFRV
jgi:hypothetical protein